jgi:6-phosphogluconolactonase
MRCLIPCLSVVGAVLLGVSCSEEGSGPGDNADLAGGGGGAGTTVPPAGAGATPGNGTADGAGAGSPSSPAGGSPANPQAQPTQDGTAGKPPDLASGAGGSGAGGSGGVPNAPTPGAGGDPADSAGGVSPGLGDAGGAAPDLPDGTAGAGAAPTDPEPEITGTPMVVIGGYDYGSNSYPLTTYDLDPESGALTERGSVDAGANPSYLALAPSGTELYVANEIDSEFGGLTALSIAADGTLSVLNHQSGSDGGFTYVAVDPSGSFAFGAAYNGGSVSVFPIQADGSLGAEVTNRDFGNQSNSHCVGFDPAGRFAFVPNKGNNEIAQLILGSDGSLSDNSPATVNTAPGAGPRHIAIHPNGGLAFLIAELDSTMTPYQISPEGTLTPGTSLSTRAGTGGQNTGAHVELSPDGHFVYGSNRGDNDIVVFAADQTSGELTLIENESSRGSTPRDFDIDPYGRVLVVANQDSNDLAVFAIANDGSLEPLGQTVTGPPQPAGVQIVYLP